VVRVRERRDLPLLPAVRSGIDMTDMNRALQSTGLIRESRPRAVVFSARCMPDNKRRLCPRRRPVVRLERKRFWCGANACAAKHTAGAVKRQPPVAGNADCAGRTKLLVRLDAGLRVPDDDAAAVAHRSRLRLARIPGRHAAFAQTTENPPDHLSAPAGERPKLCSMNEKSVSTSPRKLSANRGQLRSEGEAILTCESLPAVSSTQYTTSPIGASAQP